jgi:vacuolar-type H+-ATPase subunit E/Vma4
MKGRHLERAVLQMQIDNIHLELDTQAQRMAQQQLHMAGIEDRLRELIALSKWLQNDGGSRPAPGAGLPRKVSH